MNTKREWINGVVEGTAYWAFLNNPRKADEKFGKPPMYYIEVMDPKVIPISLSPIKTEADLKEYRIKTKTYEIPSESPFSAMDGHKYIKFQSKVAKPKELTVDPELLEKRRPKIIDSVGNPFPKDILIGNGTKVRVKFSIPKDGPEPGMNQMSPSIDAVQVIDLVEYIRPEGSMNTYGLDKVDGGYVAGATANVDTDDTTDPFAALENPKDLETLEKPRKKRAA